MVRNTIRETELLGFLWSSTFPNELVVSLNQGQLTFRIEIDFCEGEMAAVRSRDCHFNMQSSLITS